MLGAMVKKVIGLGPISVIAYLLWILVTKKIQRCPFANAVAMYDIYLGEKALALLTEFMV